MMRKILAVLLPVIYFGSSFQIGLGEFKRFYSCDASITLAAKTQSKLHQSGSTVEQLEKRFYKYFFRFLGSKKDPPLWAGSHRDVVIPEAAFFVFSKRRFSSGSLFEIKSSRAPPQIYPLI